MAVGRPAMKTDVKADALVLAGCGQMGGAMLRGWLASGAAARFVVVEPEGPPSSLARTAGIAWHRTADELPSGLRPDAVVFAVKPQVIDAVVPGYRRFVRPETLFLSIAAGTTIANLTRHLGDAAIIRPTHVEPDRCDPVTRMGRPLTPESVRPPPPGGSGQPCCCAAWITMVAQGSGWAPSLFATMVRKFPAHDTPNRFRAVVTVP